MYTDKQVGNITDIHKRDCPHCQWSHKSLPDFLKLSDFDENVKCITLLISYKLTFQPVTDEFVLKIINSAPAKSCELNPIPTTRLYENLDILLPTITNIINTSFTTGIVPHDLKTAVVKPLLKKPSLDKNLLKNYHPISNLPFLSKTPWKSCSPQTSLPSPRKQSQQPLSVSLSSRTQHRDCFVMCCK